MIVDAIEKPNYIDVRFDRSNAPEIDQWTLIVVDDDWKIVKKLLRDLSTRKRHEPPASQRPLIVQQGEARTLWLERNAKLSESNWVLAALPLHCENTNFAALDRIVFIDFPRETDESYLLYDLIASSTHPGRLAVLLDLLDRQDPRADPRVGERVYQRLMQAGLQKRHCAFLTIGAPTRRELVHVVERLSKAEMRHSLRSFDRWWFRLNRGVDYSTFLRWTEENGFHHPSELPKVGDFDEDFRAFVRQLVTQDQYGVWRWFENLYLSLSVSREDKQFSFLCAKAFIHPKQDLSFPFTALRALAWGLATLVPQKVRVSERGFGSPATTTDSGYASPAINNILALGRLDIASRTQFPFEEMARALADWIDELERDAGVARLEAIELVYGKSAELNLQFSAELNPLIFNSPSLGTVTARWQRLAGRLDGSCLGPSRDFRRVSFLFPISNQ